MPKLLTRIKDLFSGNKPSAPEKQGIPRPPKTDPHGSGNLPAYTVQFFIDRLSYVHQDPAYQSQIRVKSYQELQELGTSAQVAIPELIRKQLSNYPEERGLAKVTLEKIDPAWYANEMSQRALPFLVKSLGSEQRTALLSMQVLQQMGAHVHKPLLEVLSSDKKHEDPFVLANVLSILCKTNVSWPELKASLSGILTSSKSANLLTAATAAIMQFGEPNEEMATLVLEHTRHPDSTVRGNSLSALNKLVIESEKFLPAPLNSLSDGEKQVRHAAIEFLSGHYNSTVADFVHEVVHKKGVIAESDWNAILEQVNFWIGGKTLQAHQFNYDQLKNNLSWYNLDLLKMQAKSHLLLESAISILCKKGGSEPGLKDALVQIYDSSKSANVQQMIVSIIGRTEENWEAETLPFLLRSLSNNEKSVRDEAIRALQNHSTHWVGHPSSVSAVQTWINSLDTAHCDSAKAALLSIGQDSIPVLLSSLEQTEKRLIQQNILELLNNLKPERELTLNTLYRLRENCQNTHTLSLIGELIKKMGS
ncbi:MAG: HEAT repeat domain-containing protein [Phycisphaerae bacterium]|nr:HEAT repeat domain-containing protein [Saprospiraceae bacterium]